MGIEPFLVASSVELIIAQRLIRRLCMSCSQPASSTDPLLKTYLSQLGLKNLDSMEGLRQAKGCDQCRQLGYKGRVGIFELLTVSDRVHQAIIQKLSARDIRGIGIEEGMRTLQESGLAQIKRGLTSVEEVIHFATEDGSGEG
jgi:type II secretory ATPase GspE/PulE/Tfp pilus assembly ATPase PilB-like protein